MNWEARVLLPCLMLLCGLYIYVLFIRQPETPATAQSYTRIVIPSDSKSSFDQLLGRLRSEHTWSPSMEDTGAVAPEEDDFFLTEPLPRGPRTPEAYIEEVAPAAQYECRSGFVTFRSEFTNKYLWSHSVEHDGWLAATAPVHTPVCLRAFEVTPVDGSCSNGEGYVTLRDVGTGHLVRGFAGDEDNAWVVLAEKVDEVSTAHHFLLEKAGYIYHKHARAIVNVITSDFYPIRLHANYRLPPQAANREYAAQFTLEWLPASAIDDCWKQIEKEKSQDEQQDRALIEQIKRFSASKEKRYISFGLYGANPKYTSGAIRNAELALVYFPGWNLRFYVGGDVPQHIIDKLSSFPHVEVTNGPHDINGAAAGMFWRFIIADDPNVDRFIVRDTDSRLNARDRLAVEEWIESGKGVHIVRDHVNHCIAMNGGMWGAKHGVVRNMLKKVREWPDIHSYGADLDFLQALVWPNIIDNQVSHDAYCCHNFPHTRGFPSKRPHNYQHVGQVFDADDNARISDIDGFIRGVKAPPQCRRKPKWRYG